MVDGSPRSRARQRAKAQCCLRRRGVSRKYRLSSGKPAARLSSVMGPRMAPRNTPIHHVSQRQGLTGRSTQENHSTHSAARDWPKRSASMAPRRLPKMQTCAKSGSFVARPSRHSTRFRRLNSISTCHRKRYKASTLLALRGLAGRLVIRIMKPAACRLRWFTVRPFLDAG